MDSTPNTMIRIEKGQPDPEELAAVVAVLLAWCDGAPDPEDTTPVAVWRRPERAPVFFAPHSWRRTTR